MPRVISFESVQPIPPEFREIVQRLRALTTATSGVPSSVSQTGKRFQAVADVEMGVGHQAIVLDDRANTVTVLSARGSSYELIHADRRSTGSPVSPKAMASSKSGDVYVADRSRRIAVFRAGPSGLTLARTIETDLPIEDLCVAGSSLVVHSRQMDRGEALFLLDSAGRLIRAFGELYRSPNRYVNFDIPRGRIACATDLRIVMHVPRASIAEVRGYRLDGTVLWRTRIEGFIPADIVEPAERPGAMRVSRPQSGFHRVQGAWYDGAGRFVIQIALVQSAQLGARSEVRRLFTFALSAADGHGVLAGDLIPQLGAMGSRGIAIMPGVDSVAVLPASGGQGAR